MKRLFLPLLTALMGAVFLATGPALRAQVTFDIHVNTSALIGNSLAPFYLDFQLNDGSGGGNGNNTAFISQFVFHGGGSLADRETFGGATGSLDTGVKLTDTSFINEFFQAFTPGSSLDFRVVLSHNFDFPSPDLFGFSILDKDLFSLPTLSPSDALVLITLGGLNPRVETFATDVSNGGIAIAAPTVVSVPETSPFGVYAGLSTLALVALRRYKVRRVTPVRS